MAKKFIKLSKGGGASADDRVKYVTYMDRGAELIKYPVIEGDTARDPVAKGYIEKPTKEPTASTVYTQDGWSKTDGGAPDSTALQNVTEDRTVYAAFAESVRKYTVNFYDGDTLVHTEQVAYGGSSSYVISKEDIVFGGWSPQPTNITGDMDCYAQWIEGVGTLEETSWARISAISASGVAENFWAVGDTKSVAINGTVGTIPINETLNVYIIGFNHNSELEGTGIHFGTFKSDDGVDIALCDAAYNTQISDGSKVFNVSHWGEFNYGGWAGCDLRYDILGSTDVAPSGYGAAPVAGRIGYDATETCATNPVSNTLMAALPNDLRAVMKPMTKYTDNVGGATKEESNVTAIIDYLPLLAMTELITGKYGQNDGEISKQTQYAYYVAGHSRKKYKHSSKATAAEWWLRSTSKTHNYMFLGVNTQDDENGINLVYGYAKTNKSRGLAPIFKV